MCCEMFHPCDCPTTKAKDHCARCLGKLNHDEVLLCFDCEEGV